MISDSDEQVGEQGRPHFDGDSVLAGRGEPPQAQVLRDPTRMLRHLPATFVPRRYDQCLQGKTVAREDHRALAVGGGVADTHQRRQLSRASLGLVQEDAWVVTQSGSLVLPLGSAHTKPQVVLGSRHTPSSGLMSAKAVRIASDKGIVTATDGCRMLILGRWTELGEQKVGNSPWPLSRASVCRGRGPSSVRSTWRLSLTLSPQSTCNAKKPLGRAHQP